jgi:hypothetical protein
MKPREEEVALALPVAANIIKGKGVQSLSGYEAGARDLSLPRFRQGIIT